MKGKAGIEKPLFFSNLLAVGIDAEHQVKDYNKTFRRMAMTGIGTSMLSRGQLDGMGAGLLDLSLRGAETNSIVSGRMVFDDSAVIAFNMPYNEFQTLAGYLPEHVFSIDALEESTAMFDLLNRMGADGARIIPEILARVLEARDIHRDSLLNADRAATFDERDDLRQRTALAEYD